jgi:TRAP-type C4-dicarboxylate transport system substrate-binding protein
MKRSTLLTAAFAAALASPASAQVILNANSWVPPSHPMVTQMFLPLCQDMEKATAGRVKCNVLPKAVVAPPQSFDAIRDGLADITFIVHGYTPGRFALTDAPEFPFMGDTAETSAVAYHRIHERMLAKADEHKGVKVLAMYTHGPGTMYNTKRAIASLKDLEGLKIRVAGGMSNDVTRALGAVPMVKPAPESYELLSSGVADGTFLPKESPASFKLVPIIKYVTYVPGGLYNVSFAWIANPAKWDQIPAADRAAIEPLLGEALSRRSGRAWDAADAKGVEAVKAANIPAITASPQFVAEIKARTATLEAEWIEKKAKPKGVDGAAVLRALREEIGKAAK